MTTIAVLVGVFLYLVAGFATATAVIVYEKTNGAADPTAGEAALLVLVWPLAFVVYGVIGVVPALYGLLVGVLAGPPIWFARLIRERAGRKPAAMGDELDWSER